MNISRLRAGLLGLAFACAPALAADGYPDKPIRVIVPFPGGQGADILMRTLAPRLAEALGTSIVVENRPGAGGVVGAAYAARLPADGYNLLVGSSGPLSIAPYVNAAVSYDVRKDFTPIANLAAVTQVMVTAADGPFRTLDDVMAGAKGPQGLQFASSGIGSTSHLLMELFAQRSGSRVQHVPYKGGPQAIVDVVGGRVPVMFDAMPGVLPAVRSGKLRALAVSSGQRSPFLPDVPAVSEAGVSGFSTEGWIGLVAPAGLAPAIVARLNGEINRLLADPAVGARLGELAFRPLPMSPEAFTRFIATESELWKSVAQAAGVKPE